jgi:hypothetical protein
MKLHLEYFLFLALLFTGACGPDAESDENSFLKDTQGIYLAIEQGQDSFIRPEAQEFSSLRFPLEQFGPHDLFSENPENDFSFGLGLNEGEYISLNFNGLKACEIQLNAPKSSFLVTPTRVDVWINNWYSGNFPVNTAIPIDRPINSLDLHFRVDDGWNQMDLPLNNQQSNWQFSSQKIGRLHNSRPLGLNSILFRDCEGEVLKVATIPLIMANIQTYGFGDPLDLYFLAGKHPETGMRFTPGEAERRLIFQTPKYTPWIAIRWYQSSYPSGMLMYNTALPRGERIFDTLRGERNTIYLWDSLVTKAISMGMWAGDNQKQPVSISNFQVWSGNKWKNILPDSLPIWEKRRLDSLKPSSIGRLLHLPLHFSANKIKLNTDTILLLEEEDAIGLEVLESYFTNWRVQFRSNGYVSIYHSRVHRAENGGLSQHLSHFQGRWFYDPGSADFIGLIGKYVSNTINGDIISKQVQKVNLVAKLENNQLILPAPFEQRIPTKR